MNLFAWFLRRAWDFVPMEWMWYSDKSLEFGVRRDDDADVFVGFCPRFKVYSQGETREEALDAVQGAVVLRIATAFEHGRRIKDLRNKGTEQ